MLSIIRYFFEYLNYFILIQINMTLQKIFKQFCEPRKTHTLILRIKSIKRLNILFIQSKFWIMIKYQAHVIFNSFISCHFDYFHQFLLRLFYLFLYSFTHLLFLKSRKYWGGVKSLYRIVLTKWLIISILIRYFFI